jgi:DNA-binding FadR family transcriptional regulator
VKTYPFSIALWWLVSEYLPTLKSGDTITAYKLLAEEVGVHHTTVREALRVLEFHNVIDIQHGKATKFVSLNRPALMYVLKEKGIL